MPTRRRILILSNDPFAAALLGWLAERSGYVAAFAEPGERPEEAMARIQPIFVVLLDASLPAAQSDLFFGLAARRQVGLAVLIKPQNGQSPAAWALERDVPCFNVPTDSDQFARVIEAASASNWWRARRDRRAVPQTVHEDDGTLVYVDRVGARWRVYDRRSGSDRRDGDERRIFVNATGAAWACKIGGSAEGLTPTELERQLARATRLPEGEDY